MSKKFVAFSILTLFMFICWCGNKNDNTNDLETDIEKTETTNNLEEVPVAEKTDWEAVVMQWGRDDEAVEINDTFEEPL